MSDTPHRQSEQPDDHAAETDGGQTITLSADSVAAETTPNLRVRASITRGSAGDRDDITLEQVTESLETFDAERFEAVLRNVARRVRDVNYHDRENTR